jgi:hypothetical protein
MGGHFGRQIAQAQQEQQARSGQVRSGQVRAFHITRKTICGELTAVWSFVV